MNLWPCNGTVVGIHGSSMMQQSVERDAQPAVTRFLHRDRPADVGTRMRQVNILNSSRPIESWWRHQMETFSALLVLCAGNSPVTGEFPHKGQWRRALTFSSICAWITDWVINRETGDLRSYRAYYDVIVMWRIFASVNWAMIGSDNGLSPVQRQAIISSKALLLSIGD